MNSANFSTSDSMDDKIFGIQHFSRVCELWFPDLVFLIWWVETRKRHILGAHTFFCRLASELYQAVRRITGKQPFFWLLLRRIFFTTAESATHTLMGLPLILWRSVLCKWVLLRDAIRKRGLCCCPVSVRLYVSVRPSVTLVHCIQMAEDIVRGGRQVERPLPSPPLPFPPLLSSPLRRRPLKSSYGVWGSAVSSPNGVWGGAPSEIDFGAF